MSGVITKPAQLSTGAHGSQSKVVTRRDKRVLVRKLRSGSFGIMVQVYSRLGKIVITEVDYDEFTRDGRDALAVGDVIKKVNNIPVTQKEHYYELMRKLRSTTSKVVLTVHSRKLCNNSDGQSTSAEDTEVKTAIEDYHAETAVEEKPVLEPVVKNLNSVIVDLIECQVCLDPILPPVYQCKLGHLICSKCKPSLTRCPTCNDHIIDIRNTVMDKICDSLRYPCRNVETGCNEIICLRDKNSHEDNCRFKMYNCPTQSTTGCKWKGLHGQIVTHGDSYHKNQFHRGLNWNIRINLRRKSQWHKYMVAVGAIEEFFTVKVSFSPNSGLFQACVVYAGPRKRAESYIYKFTVQSSTNNNCKLVYSSNTRSDMDTETGECFINTATGLQQFANDGVVNMRLEISKCDR